MEKTRGTNNKKYTKKCFLGTRNAKHKQGNESVKQILASEVHKVKGNLYLGEGGSQLEYFLIYIQMGQKCKGL